MKALEVLFGSGLRVKILRFLFQNQDYFFTPKDLKVKIRLKGVRIAKISKELKLLMKASLVNKKKSGAKKLFGLNKNFEFYQEFFNIFTRSGPQIKEKVEKFAKRIPGLRLLLVSGVFLGRPARIDLFLVADKAKESLVKNIVKNLEGDLGKEINYAFMNSDEFKYRMEMMDRFLKDIFSGAREIVINKFKEFNLGA